ncbi:MAG: serine/threonine protein kinase [Myxococcales bacterium]|nr:serine/threonine protein kinase [Myxococcales bacterium]MCB9669199.1 serine/threonine protein kinase [Alphaproteobacteria bacterium]MCB9692910.1 serine/threonine protein kinase [Alphaproteobacteria bacterium]
MTVLSADVVGKVLNDRYEVLALDREELLGSVYAGLDRQAGRRVAIKVLHPHLTEDASKFKRFGREITNTWMITQQNTVEVLDWGEDGDLHYLVMEFLRAHTLEEELKDGPMPVERAVRIAVQIARAIGAAHQEGIVHRALAPSNVLLLDNAVDGADFVKVRDFGLSKLEKVDDEDTGLTTQNTRVGNAEYMAPEYIKTSTYHTKGDLYALGALLYQMVAGKPPFTGPTLDVLQAHVGKDPDPLSKHAEGVPEWLDALVAGTLAKKPEERPGAYRIVQMLETGMGSSLEPPALYPLDVNGDFVVPTGPPRVAMALGVALLVGLGAALVMIGVIVLIAALFVLRSAGYV